MSATSLKERASKLVADILARGRLQQQELEGKLAAKDMGINFRKEQFANEIVQLVENERSAAVRIKGTRCPACSNELLFVGEGGRITCSWAECPNPNYQAALDAVPVDMTLYDLVDKHVHENTRFHLVDWLDHRQLLKGLYRWREETTQRLIRKNWAEAFELGRKAALKRLQSSGK